MFLRMRNISDKFVEKIKTHSLCSITFSENRAVYEIMRNIFTARHTTDDNTVQRMRIAC